MTWSNTLLAICKIPSTSQTRPRPIGRGLSLPRTSKIMTSTSRTSGKFIRMGSMGLLGTDTHGRRMSRLGMLSFQCWFNISDILLGLSCGRTQPPSQRPCFISSLAREPRMGVSLRRGTSPSTGSLGNSSFIRSTLLFESDGWLQLRNETVDATHLCEFHQVEGVIADYGLTLGGLMEFMEIFFGAMGVTDLRFKPACVNAASAHSNATLANSSPATTPTQSRVWRSSRTTRGSISSSRLATRASLDRKCWR